MTVYTDLNDAPKKHYGVVYADPAWRFKTYAPPKEGQRGRRDVERHYPTMSLEEIKAMPVRRVAATNSYLMMWCSWPHLLNGLAVIDAWGFKYVSSFQVWFKMKKGFSPTRVFVELPGDMHIGSGYTTRKNTEFILLAKRGSPKRLARDVWEPLFSPVREHSRKPEIYDTIQRYAAGPYLELNARTERPGWDQWGNEVGKFPQPEAPSTPLEFLAQEPEQIGLFPEAAE